jgi:hypothetical protein
MTSLPALALLVEGALTVMWLTNLLSTLSVYRGVTFAFIALRGLVGAMQLTSGWWLLSKRPAAPALATASLAASAVLTVAEVGLRLAPSNLDPAFRWPFVTVYAVYAAFMVALLTRARRSK